MDCKNFKDIIFQTERLVLRNVKEKDAYIMFEYRNNKKCSKYQRNQTKDLLGIKNLVYIMKNAKIDLKKSVIFAISLKTTDEIIGEVVIMPKGNTISLGYTISYKYHRRGFAYEILSKLIDYLHIEYPFCEFICLVDPENIASIKLLEKLGYEFIEYVEEIDSNMYGKYIIE